MRVEAYVNQYQLQGIQLVINYVYTPVMSFYVFMERGNYPQTQLMYTQIFSTLKNIYLLEVLASSNIEKLYRSLIQRKRNVI